ncbi:Long-chain-fatty-acid--CoA ligase [Psychrobacter pasteurii]|uniref:Long-chain-fatty-acid--CoA ligase n=2 Tax=Psychrobacter pasteurii TaxID=1945520 RepID=A0A1R4EFG0_9GAMM|nr:AMP-binding protein [Psychrobacter pasteurii]SJM37216.1 Long-chain-fatty-acid--CoA ligase [Psychrobacter pasteurii]
MIGSVNSSSNTSNASSVSKKNPPVDLSALQGVSMGAKSANAPLKMSHDRGPETPLIEATIGDFFDAVVEKYPDREALVVCHQNIRWTYRELQQKVNQLASAMIEMGLEIGDRVGIWSHNNAEWLLMQLATAKVGVILVNINPAYRSFELQYALNKLGCTALVLMRHFKTSDYANIIRELCPEIYHKPYYQLDLVEIPTVERIIWIDEPGSDEEFGFMQKFSEWMQDGDANDPRVAERQAQLKNTDAINVQFTSGTTGTPKGATLTHRNILNNGYFIGEAMDLSEEDRLCIPVPLYHCFGMVLGNLAILTHGGCIVYPNDGFEPLSVLEAVQSEKCTALHGVPTMFIAELDHPDFDKYDLSTLRTGIMAGSSCPIEVMRRVIDEMHMSEVTIAYGMTETSPVSCQTNKHTPLEKQVSTVGLVQPNLEVKIVDTETGEVVPVGETGELLTKGYSVMKGYWGSRFKTKQSIQDGWMHTGDLATMDEEGYIKVVGRSKDMVIRGGENIYPVEIENYLYRHPKISDVQIVGVPDKKYGEVLAAWIIPRKGVELTEDEVKQFCKDNIAHYKVPQYYRFVTEYPMTITGKIQKYKITEMMIEELGL